MATLLVTGGAGYIGSVCAAMLLERGHRVVVVDDLSTGFRDAVPAEAEFHQVDLADRQQLGEVFRRHAFAGVLHFAAKALIPESVVNPGVFFDRNVASGVALFETMRQFGVGRLTLASTAAVYGAPEATPIREDHPTRPLNAYGESKLMLERMLAWYASAYGWVAVAFRFFSAAGALPSWGERHAPETHLIPLVLEAAAGRRANVRIFGDDYDTPDGSCLRDFVHVRDLIEAHVSALDLPADSGFQVFNVGSGVMYSVRAVCAAAERVTGRRLRLETAPRRAGDPAALCASPERLMTTLRWRPRHSDLDTILQDAWTWAQRPARGGEPE